jgi:hypothetical protein
VQPVHFSKCEVFWKPPGVFYVSPASELEVAVTINDRVSSY